MLTRNLTKIVSSQSKLLANNSQYCFARQSFADKMRQKNNIHNQAADPTADPEVQFTARDYVASNAGLNAFLSRVYKTTGAGVCTALTTTTLVSKMPYVYYHPYITMFGGLAMTLGGIFGSMSQAPTYHVDVIKGQQALRTTNSGFRIGLYGLGMAGLGVSAAPMLGMFNMVNPAIVPTAAVLSLGIFGSASLYAYTRPKDSLIGWGNALYSGLLGMVGLQLVGGLTSLAMGPNMFSSALHRVDTFVGVGLFSALVAYETHTSIKAYEEGNADHLMMSIDFALDFWNIFIRVAEILYMFSRND